MRVVILTQDFPPRRGGMARYYARLAEGLGSDCVVAMGKWGNVKPVPEGKETVIALPFPAEAAHRPPNVWLAGRYVSAAIKRHKAEVILIGNLRPYSMLGISLAKKHRLPVAVFYHGMDILKTSPRWQSHFWKKRWWKRLVDETHLHIANSRYTAGETARLGLPEKRTAIVPPEVDNEVFHPVSASDERQRLRERFGIPLDRKVTLFVGRLVDCKGVEELLRAFALVDPETHLVLAGPESSARWVTLAEDLGVAERVQFLHLPLEQIPDLYRAADLFVAPSRDVTDLMEAESFGIVYIEAAASGLAVVGTRTAGIPESVDDGGNGFLVTPGDVGELAATWTRLLGNDDLRARLGEAGVQGRGREYGKGTSAARLRAVLRERFESRERTIAT